VIPREGVEITHMGKDQHLFQLVIPREGVEIQIYTRGLNSAKNNYVIPREGVEIHNALENFDRFTVDM